MGKDKGKDADTKIFYICITAELQLAPDSVIITPLVYLRPAEKKPAVFAKI